VGHDRIRNAAEQHAADARETVGTHHHEPNLVALRLGEKRAPGPVGLLCRQWLGLEAGRGRQPHAFESHPLRRLAIGLIELFDGAGEARRHERPAVEHDLRQPHPGVADQSPAATQQAARTGDSRHRGLRSVVVEQYWRLCGRHPGLPASTGLSGEAAAFAARGCTTIGHGGVRTSADATVPSSTRRSGP
jgi:hypothetical protein